MLDIYTWAQGSALQSLLGSIIEHVRGFRLYDIIGRPVRKALTISSRTTSRFTHRSISHPQCIAKRIQTLILDSWRSPYAIRIVILVIFSRKSSSLRRDRLGFGLARFPSSVGISVSYLVFTDDKVGSWWYDWGTLWAVPGNMMMRGCGGMMIKVPLEMISEFVTMMYYGDAQRLLGTRRGWTSWLLKVY